MKNPKTIKGLAQNVRRAMARAQKPMKKKASAQERVVENVRIKVAAVFNQDKDKKNAVDRILAEAMPDAEARRTKDWPGRVLESGANSTTVKEGAAKHVLGALGAAGALSWLADKATGTKDKAKKKVKQAQGRTGKRLARYGVAVD